MNEWLIYYTNSPEVMGAILAISGVMMLAIYALNMLTWRRIVVYTIIFTGVVGVQNYVLPIALTGEGVDLNPFHALSLLVWASLEGALLVTIFILWIAKIPIYRFIEKGSAAAAWAVVYLDKKAKELKGTHPHGATERLIQNINAIAEEKQEVNQEPST